jgi:hypothetical protein
MESVSGEKKMKKAHHIEEVSFKGTVLRMQVDGLFHEIDLALCSKAIAGASKKHIENIEISPSGYGLHWPDLDEDLSIDGLLGISHRPPSFAEAEDKPSVCENH